MGRWASLKNFPALVFIPGGDAEPKNREHHLGSFAAWWGPSPGLVIIVGGAQT